MEPPGTAPGSDPLMTSAFMSIAPLPEHCEHMRQWCGFQADAPPQLSHRERIFCEKSGSENEVFRPVFFQENGA